VTTGSSCFPSSVHRISPEPSSHPPPSRTFIISITLERLEETIERAATQTPQAIAVRSRDARISYADLDARSNQLARVLRTLGIAREICVAVCAERSPNAVVALAAIAKSGGAFVPLDPASPDERLRIVLDDVRPAVVIVDAALAHRFTSSANTTIRTFDQLCADAARESDAPLTFERTPRDLAYVLYTSGSTGAPKGVMVEHRSVCNTLAAAITDFALDGADRVLQLAPLSFDPSIWQIFGTWAAGGCVVLPPPGAERDPDEIAADIRTHRVSVLIGVPAMLALLIEREDLAHGTALRIAVSGGSSVSPALRDRFRARDLPLYNVYGPTEASIQVTTHPCAGDDERPFVPLGAAIANMRVDVLDADRVPVGAGEIGELYLGGIGVARGYLHRDALTAERFVPDPRASEPGARMYRTGDLGRLHDDGAIEFAGRVDDQVKVRGVRIELDEIGGVLESHPQVRSAVAVVSDDRIHAFVIARTVDDALPTELRAHARSMLAPAAVPATVTLIDEFPAQPSGKVDRAALMARTLTAPVTRRAAPPDPLSAVLAGIWEDLFHRSDFGLDDDFFELGGDSLLAARMLARIEQRLGQRLPLVAFFAEPTIAGIATALLQAEEAGFTPVAALRASGTKPPLFYLHGDPTGMGMYARRFCDLIDSERPIYAIAPHGTDGGATPETIEAMASDHVEAIRAIEPDGPYVLGGYCMGGVVAFDVARQLEEAGQTVLHVTMIEAHPARNRFAQFVERPLVRLASIVGMSPARLRPWLGRVRNAVHAVRVRLHDPYADDPVSSAQDRAVAAYVWQPIRSGATMLYAREEPGMTPARIRKLWDGMFASLQIQGVPGNHQTALGRHIDEVTAALSDALERSGS
jgi:amino acid adenylation domain-containing protein